MSRKATKPIVLIVVFLASLFLFSTMINKENKDITTTMEEATLPVLHFVYNDRILNELHGYKQEMDMLSMRDGLMPLDENRQLHLEIMTYGNEIDSLSYKIRSIDSERLLVEEKTALASGSEKAVCDITLPSIFEDNVEYNMEIALTMGDETIYYYTRIMRATNCYVEETIDFALQFHEYTFREDAVDFIPTYMDPATGDAATLNYVDLSCTLGQITWGKFEGAKLTEPVVSVKEMNFSYNVIILNYVMTNVNENNEVEYYNVEEYYRLRQTGSRMYVLNFERKMEQIFQSENDFLLRNTAILLGIRDQENVEFLGNDSGDCIAFVQEGDLWYYDRLNNTITQVFSFRGQEGINNRENWNQHDIKIVRVDEAGSISFIVYGYMNRGVHEGMVGIGVYHYDGLNQTVEEEVFVTYNKSYEVLKAELGSLLYVNEQKQFYFALNNNIYQIDLTNFQMQMLVEGGSDDYYATSKSGRYLAWVNPENINASTSITLADLKTGIYYEITSDDDTYLKPITFIGEDFAYGCANQADVSTDASGRQRFLMQAIKILNTSEEKQNVIKEYCPAFGKIGEISFDRNNIYVEIVEEENGSFVSVSSDTIMNRESSASNGIEVTTNVSEVKQRQVALTMKEVNSETEVEILPCKHVLVEENRTVSMDVEGKDYYYVYAKGKLLLATQDPSKAIKLANGTYGVVVDSDLKYIYKRARNTAQTALQDLTVSEADAGGSSIVKCISAMLNKEGAGLRVNELIASGQTPVSILKTALKDARVMELSNSTMDELLYFIDQETPVFAKIGNNEAILLAGYSASYVYYYEPSSGQIKSAGYEQMEAWFNAGGNYFIAYVK